MKRQHGDFPETGLEEAAPHKSEPLAKSEDELTSEDIERMADALEILERRAPKLSKARLFQIQYKAGLLHRQFQKAVFDYITRPRGGNVKSDSLSKVQRDSGSMSDVGLDSSDKLIIPSAGTAEKFVKTKAVDAFGEEIDRK